MTETLLKTKCMVPGMRPQWVNRPRLEGRFRQALEAPLTLVSAPPGFGKTTATLTASLILQAESKGVLAWLSLDSFDNEPERFWRYFTGSLETALSAGGQTRSPSLQSLSIDPFESLPTQLLNHILSDARPYLYVLDDYHLIQESEIHKGLTFLIENAPPNLHLLVVTRADPPLPLHRLRARGQLVEVRASELRFDHAESTAFLIDTMSLSLNDHEITQIMEQTEGWAVGLQMAALALQGTPATLHASSQRSLIERLAQSNRYILEYLAEEVLAQQPSEVRSFMLQTAILHRLCGSLCDAVTDGQDAQAMLENLARRNLFLLPIGVSESPGEEQSWFRYHQLFADLLVGVLQQQYPELVPILHERAARWYQKQGEVEFAVEHALTGENYALAEEILDLHAKQLVMQGHALRVEGWLRRLPEGWSNRLPHAALAFAWLLLLRGQYREAEPYLQQIDAAIPTGDLSLEAELAVIRAALANTYGRFEDALRHAQYALSHLPSANRSLQAMASFIGAGAQRDSGNINAAIAGYEQAIPLCRAARLPLPEMLSRAHLGYLYMTQGQLRRAEAITRPALDFPANHPAMSAAQAALGEVLMEWNQLEESEQHLHQALRLAKQSGHNAALVRILLLFSRLRRVQQDLAEAQIMLEAASVEILQGTPAWMEPLLLAEKIWFELEQGSLDAAERLLEGRTKHIDLAEGHVREVVPLARARLWARQGRALQALTLLDEIMNMSQSGGRQGRFIEALLLRASIQVELGEQRAAQHSLQQALILAEPQNYLRVFLETGVTLIPLLAQIDGAYARRILEAFPVSERQDLLHDVMPESLTERELEVLRLMAQGLTYQDIADQLVISINTVRYHIKGLYTKLGVESRTLALEKARTLRLI